MIFEGNKIYLGDCLKIMRKWPDGIIQTCVTSPPYWGLRDYGVKGQIGLEKTMGHYISKMVKTFREVRRVLKDDGTLWLNMGDNFLPGKQMAGMPWRLAFALQADGWFLRSDIIWSKPNPMPESVTDRPTKAHEYIFLFAKSPIYFYDADAIKEPAIYGAMNSPESIKSPYGQGFTRTAQHVPSGWDTGNDNHDKKEGRYKNDYSNGAGRNDGGRHNSGGFPKQDKQRGHGRRHDGFNDRWDDMERLEQCTGMRNKRSVWNVATAPFSEAHFATFPTALIKPCILAGSRERDLVLDPFMGAGTTALVAARYNRWFVGCELNPSYVAIAEKRISAETSQIKMDFQ